jgi:pyruvate,water dikinase
MRLPCEGICVPDGFCISTEAFQRVIEKTPSIHELLEQLSFLKVNDRDKIHELSSEIRRIIEGIAIPEEISEAEAIAHFLSSDLAPGKLNVYSVTKCKRAYAFKFE